VEVSGAGASPEQPQASRSSHARRWEGRACRHGRERSAERGTPVRGHLLDGPTNVLIEWHKIHTAIGRLSLP